MKPNEHRDSTSGVALDGGVASDVAVVQEPDGREIVIKQALAKLKVAADWRADPSRSSIEADALRVAAELLGAECVPRVLWIDAPNHRFAMERIDRSLDNWRAQLSRGEVDLDTATRAAELLAQLHTHSAGRRDLAERFANREFFEQLRIEPFFTRSAQRNPDVSARIEHIIELLRAPGTALVHGDYSPKNILARGHRVVILDWEVTHWGDPRFDVAFCLSHLLLGGLRFSTSTADFRRAAIAFATAYFKQGAIEHDDSLLVALTGCLVLARLDGDSPVDYLNDLDVPHVRDLALQLIDRQQTTLLDICNELLS